MILLETLAKYFVYSIYIYIYWKNIIGNKTTREIFCWCHSNNCIILPWLSQLEIEKLYIYLLYIYIHSSRMNLYINMYVYMAFIEIPVTWGSILHFWRDALDVINQINQAVSTITRLSFHHLMSLELISLDLTN